MTSYSHPFEKLLYNVLAEGSISWIREGGKCRLLGAEYHSSRRPAGTGEGAHLGRRGRGLETRAEKGPGKRGKTREKAAESPQNP